MIGNDYRVAALQITTKKEIYKQLTNHSNENTILLYIFILIFVLIKSSISKQFKFFKYKKKIM